MPSHVAFHPPVVINGAECAFCDQRAPAYDEAGTLVYLYQILLAGGGSVNVCRDCWYRAEHGSCAENVTEIMGVHTIYAHA